MTSAKTNKSSKSSKSHKSTKSAESAPSALSSTPSPAPAQTTAPPTGSAPISAATVAQCIALLGQVDSLIGPVTPLSGPDIRRALKRRKGGAQVITQVLDLCIHHGIPAVGPVTVQGMSDQVARATALNQIGVPMNAVQKKLSDASFTAESASWQSATAFYTMLQRLSVVDPTLAAGLQPVTAFFQTKTTKNGTQRLKVAVRKARKADATLAKHKPVPETAAPPAAPNGNGAPAAAPPATNGSAPAAPVATVAPVTPAPANATHS